MRRITQLLLVTSLVPLLLLGTFCSKSPTDGDDDGEPTDNTPPVAISSLQVINQTSQSLTLLWTAPHDYTDDHSDGFVDEYDLRVSYDTITAANFAQGYRIDSVGAPAPAGVVQQTAIEELEPDSTYYFAIKSRDASGNWSAISNCCMGHCPAIEHVIIADTALERIVREHIHKPTDQLYSSDVDTVTELRAEELEIESLGGLEHFTSLANVLFAFNEIGDLTPLSGLDNLWGVHLSSNNVSDMSPLQGLTHVTQLHLGDNPIADISPMASMTSLRQVFLHMTQVTDYSPLYGLTYLDDVHFGFNGLTDIEFMSHLTHVRIAVLVHNQISDLTPLASLTAIIGLGLNNNQISDISPLTGLTNLQSVDLAYNQITDIQALVNNAGIGAGDIVYLGNNPLSANALTVQIPALEARGVTVHK